jgi:hypothetical protein
MISLCKIKKIKIKNKVVKPNRIYNFSCRFDGLSRETRVNPIYYCLDIKTNIFLKKLKSNYVFYRLSLNLSYQLYHIKTTSILISFKQVKKKKIRNKK